MDKSYIIAEERQIVTLLDEMGTIMSIRPGWLAAFVAALAFAAGCGPGETPRQGCDLDCNNKEVSETGCDHNPVDAIVDTEVDPKAVNALRGTLALRRGTSNNQGDQDACTHIYWSRFTPSQENHEPFAVVAVVNAFDERPSQLSKPGEPGTAAWTRGYYVGLSMRINACVIELSSGKRFCLASTTGV